MKSVDNEKIWSNEGTQVSRLLETERDFITYKAKKIRVCGDSNNETDKKRRKTRENTERWIANYDRFLGALFALDKIQFRARLFALHSRIY